MDQLRVKNAALLKQQKKLEEDLEKLDSLGDENDWPWFERPLFLGSIKK